MININRILRHMAYAVSATIATAAVLSSCQQELVPTGELQPSGEETAPVTLTASFAQTKASYAEDGSNNLQPSWELGDVVHGYTSDGSHYTFTVKEVNGGVATLKGEATDGAFHLVFNCDGPCVSYDGQKGDKTMPAVMLADGVIAGMSGSFVFHNAGAVVGITNARGVPAGTEILKVTISGENLSSGTFTLGSPGSLTADSKSSDVISTLTLSGITVGSGDDRALSRPVYMAVAPGAKIAEVTLDAGDETYHYSLDPMVEAQVNDYLYVKGQYFTREIGPLLDGKFSVSPTEYVQFSRGNLYCTDNGAGSSPRYVFGFESNQYDSRLRKSAGNYSVSGGSPYTVPANESGMFQWNKYNAVSGGDYGAFSTGSPSLDINDSIEWGEAMSDGEMWYTLNSGQWRYLISRTSASDKSLVSWAIVGGIEGLVLAPDDHGGFDGTCFECTISQWQEYESSGLVFLPGCGEIPNGDTFSMYPGAYYLASDAYSTQMSYLLCAYYNSYDSTLSVDVGFASKSSAHPVRLVQKFEWTEVEPAFIDLDLPSGTLWADVNLGATMKTGPGSYGKFYAWGETELKSSFSIDNYSFTDSYIKYNGTDGLVTLEAEDDAASVSISGSHIPTAAQFEELINSAYTTCTWTADYNDTGIAGLLVISNANSSSIFLPAAGLSNSDGTALRTTNGCYWSSSLNPTPDSGAGTSFPACALDLDFSGEVTPFVYAENDNSQRFLGQSIRPVKDSEP